MIDWIEKKLFLDGIHMRYGYDFRHYAEASLNRRLSQILILRQQTSLIDVLAEVFKSPEVFRRILPLLTVGTTEFFRDPAFFRALREKIFPLLKTYPSIRIWIAGSSTGEEVVSLAILLKEENLLARSTIYATDINPEALKKAKEGIFNVSALQSFVKNYAVASGLRTPSEYYTSEYGAVRFSPELLQNVVFSEHNLVTDAVFTEAHLILCRNVLIYFDRELQSRVFDLFAQSLVHRGFLGIGSKESIKLWAGGEQFDPIDLKLNLYQLRGPA